MKLLEYYANHFKKYGDLKSVKHPYTKNVIRKNEPCMFNKVCSSTNTLMIMSSRKGDDIFYVCEDCIPNYFVSWNQPDMVKYHLDSTGVDLNADVPKAIPNMNQFVKGEVYRVIQFGEVHEMTLWDAELVMEKDEYFYMLSFNKVFAWFDKDLVSRDGTMKVLIQ